MMMNFILTDDIGELSVTLNSLQSPAKECKTEAPELPVIRIPYKSRQCKFISGTARSSRPSALIVKGGLKSNFNICNSHLSESTALEAVNTDLKTKVQSSELQTSQCLKQKLIPISPQKITLSNNLVKVKLGCLEPLGSGEVQTGPISEISSELCYQADVREEKLESSNLKSEERGILRKKTVVSLSKMSDSSSRPHFTIGSYDLRSYRSVKTSKYESGSLAEQGHRIDTVIDLEEILANNLELTEYMRQKREKEEEFRKTSRSANRNSKTVTFGGNIKFSMLKRNNIPTNQVN